MLPGPRLWGDPRIPGPLARVLGVRASQSGVLRPLLAPRPRTSGPLGPEAPGPPQCRARRTPAALGRGPSSGGAAGRAGGGPAVRADPAAASPHPPAAPRRPLAPRRRRRHAQGVGRRPRRQQPPAPCAPARPRRPPRGPRARPPAPTPPRARARAPTPPPPHRLRRAGGRRAARAGGRRSMRRGRHGCYRHRRRQAGLQHFRPPPPASWRLKGDASLLSSPRKMNLSRRDLSEALRLSRGLLRKISFGTDAMDLDNSSSPISWMREIKRIPSSTVGGKDRSLHSSGGLCPLYLPNPVLKLTSH